MYVVFTLIVLTTLLFGLVWENSDVRVLQC